MKHYFLRHTSSQPLFYKWVTSTCFITLLLILVGCSHEPSAKNDLTKNEKSSPVEVVAVKAELTRWPTTITVQGTLMGDEHATVSSKMPGRVGQVEVELGCTVNQGDPLIILDRLELQLRLKQVEAQLEQACAAIGLKREDDEETFDLQKAPQVALARATVEETAAALKRAQQLLPKDVITKAEFETFQAQHQTAVARMGTALNEVREQIAIIGVRRAELALATQHVEDAAVKAPFDGIVEQRLVALGEYVQVGDPVIKLVRAKKLRFIAGVPERKAALLRKGQSILISVPGQSEPLSSEIKRVSPAISQSSRSLWIEADIDNADLALQAGLFAEAEITVAAESKTLTVPRDAVSDFAGVQKVWIIEEGTARPQPVRIGRRTESELEILAGLQPGNTIIQAARQGRAGPVIAIQTPKTNSIQATKEVENETAEDTVVENGSVEDTVVEKEAVDNAAVGAE